MLPAARGARIGRRRRRRSGEDRAPRAARHSRVSRAHVRARRSLAAQGNDREETSIVEKSALKEKMLEYYDLEIDTDIMGKNDTLSKADLAAFLLSSK